MKKRMLFLYICLLSLFGMIGCTSPTQSATTVTLTFEPIASATCAPQPPLDSANYDGVIVITQYYSFLGNGLHEKAYGLLSKLEQSKINLEDYVNDARWFFKTVEIITILPIEEYFHEVGIISTPPDSGSIFYVQIKAWGVGNMSGSRMNGVIQTLFLRLVLEEGHWRIDGFGSSL